MMRDRRRKRFNEQLVEALGQVSNALKAGFSITQAFDTVVQNGENPIAQEFEVFLQQQRVGIARALVVGPDLLLADEPTGNLDPVTSAEIMQLLTDINRRSGTTMLISTHDFMTIDRFPARVLVCEGGTVVDSEAPAAQ